MESSLFDEVIGHHETIDRLVKTFRRDHVPSSLLFTGISGIGKSLVTKKMAQMLNCECGESKRPCESCRMFNNNSHPDFICVKPKTRFIQIAQIQQLIEKLSLRPVYAKKRVVLIQDAHQMNLESANSFLKLLEEPPIDTLIVLTTWDAQLLIETILSRCQIIPFAPLNTEQLREIVSGKFSLTEADLNFVLNYSNGQIRKDLTQNATYLNVMRIQVLRMLESITTEQFVEHAQQIEKWIKKEQHFYFLEFLAQWLLDFFYLLEGRKDRLRNQDQPKSSDSIKISFSKEQLIDAFNLIIDTEMAIKANAAKPATLECLLILLKQILSGYVVA
ncbi:MAG: AAA family ATPase [Deltaproteobacteria bacterium]|nr:AAA family ATPase [Deltaproteobacteria bacterium]